MPVIKQSSYEPPGLFKNGHLQTIYPAAFRTNWLFKYKRERIWTPDNDFLDLDWSFVGPKRLAILSHGLEGHSGHSYMMGMAKALNTRGISSLSWNFRGCSGELNRKKHFYHVGFYEDLETIVRHVEKSFDEIYLIGFSLGGNITLKYLASLGSNLHPKIKSAVVFSVPVDIKAVADKLTASENLIYFKKFMWSIRKKALAKSQFFEFPTSLEALREVKSFKDLDDWFTAPMFGYENADELWRDASSLSSLDKIHIPTLLVNAKDDPLLSQSCFPYEIAKKSPHLFLETPEFGGHVGFVAFNRDGEYWSESRALEFIESNRR